MRKYTIALSDERIEELEKLAEKQGVTVDDLVHDMVNRYMLNSHSVTRFAVNAAKKWPKGR